MDKTHSLETLKVLPVLVNGKREEKNFEKMAKDLKANLSGNLRFLKGVVINEEK